MSSMLLPAVAALVAAGFGIALLELLIKRADVGAGLLLAGAVASAFFVDDVPSLLLPGETRVEVTDLVAGLLWVAAVARYLRLPRLTNWQRGLVLLCFLLVLSLARGIGEHGLQTAVNEFRLYLIYAGSALYISSFPPSARLWNRIGKVWLIMAVPMLLLVLIRWLGVFLEIDLGVPEEKYGNDAAIRVLDGPYAFFLAHAFFLTVPQWLQGRRRGWVQWLSVILCVVVLLLNRRTVWLALLIGVAVVVLRDRKLGRKANMLVAATAVLSVAMVFVFSGELAGSADVLGQSASNIGNFSWRVVGWQELIAHWSREPVNWFFGEPFGAGYHRFVDGSGIDAHPHNFYVQTLLRGGVLAAVLLLCLTFGLLRSLWRGPTRDPGLLGPSVMPALVAMQLVWFLTWVPGTEQGIVTGLACAMAFAGSRARAAEDDDEPAPPPAPLAPAGERILAIDGRE